MFTAWLDRAIRLALNVAYRGYRLYWYVAHPHTQGVYVALWSRGELLVIRNSYRDSVSVPGGAVKSREDFATAAARELEEEVGVHVDPSDLSLISTYTVHEYHHLDTVTVFEVDFGEERPQFTVDRREVVWADFLPLTAARGARLAKVVCLYLDEKAKGSSSASQP